LKKSSYNLLKTTNSLMLKRKIWRLVIQIKMLKLKNFRKKKRKKIRKLLRNKNK
jgi:hypothetical protein